LNGIAERLSMNAQHFTRFGVFLALSAGCFAGSALAQPEGAEPSARTEEQGRAQRDDGPALAPALDRSLLKRLQELEGARRAARQEGLKDPKAWEANRAQRASAHRQQLAVLWGSVVGTLDGQARLRMHADRMARLNRMLDLAQQKHDQPLTATINADIASALAHHVQAMQKVKAEAGLQ
jgi:hypothetical protein